MPWGYWTKKTRRSDWRASIVPSPLDVLKVKTLSALLRADLFCRDCAALAVQSLHGILGDEGKTL